MHTGIYLLSWDTADLYYVGQSTNIERRFIAHKSTAKHNKHRNYKVQDAFNTYGEPTLTILDICEIDELDSKEKYWVNEFKSSSLLNISEVFPSTSGTLSPSSKYSKNTILRVFSLLYRTDKPLREIAMLCDTSIGIPGNISRGDTHTWLKEEYPEKYSRMVNRRKGAVSNRKLHSSDSRLIYCDGSIHEVCNITEFAKNASNTYNRKVDPSSISKLLRGLIKSHSGFQVYTGNNILKSEAGSKYTNYKYSAIKHIESGKEYLNVTNAAEFCRNNEYLKNITYAAVGISKLLKGRNKTSYGFVSLPSTEII